ncbi:alpha-1,6-mannosylglycoprotein 6-beta-N-acetylglucosaminyltransferase B-like [Gadus macrocephalus]|uniref:alpha-1,6-mannosylglycoprotein 6-beta-N-acetylglucosaminyltransferase B-like n=1 Tax=Gadus macrocephalus TaxID=80720 RepID=UPI0028CB2A0E|nr:alpha-1,6-mannosylglycoprotein 6-beta-N-acetylglucosaminyltransferase B-like [Gadus macrocephalus]
MRLSLRPRSGCLLICLCVSVGTLLLQSLWVPGEESEVTPAGRSPEEQAQRGPVHGSWRGGPGVGRLALRLEALSAQLQRLSQERDAPNTDPQHLHLLVQSLRQDQQGLVQSVEEQLKRISQKIDQLSLHHRLHQEEEPPPGPLESCSVTLDPRYPACSEKVEFLRVRWQLDPCYAFYGVDGTTCSILTYLSQVEDFCPLRLGRNQSVLPWQHTGRSKTEKAEIRTTLSSLYEEIGSSRGPALGFVRSRVEQMSREWIQAGLRMKQSSNNTASPQMKVLLYPGVLAGPAGQRFGSMVERGGPLGELVQWADLSACLTILGHNLTLSTSRDHLHSLIGAAPGGGSCPIQRPLPFDLIYTDYHGLAHLQGAMGLTFQHYQCRFRILDSFGTEPAFNMGSYARSHGYRTLWGSWGLQPLQYMTMFPHTPDNSLMGFAVRQGVRTESRKHNVAVVYGKQQYMWQGMADYIQVLSSEMEVHGTVYQPPGGSAPLPPNVTNHGLLAQDQFHRLLNRAKVFVGLGFPYEGPAPIEALALGCVFLQPSLTPPNSSSFYRGKPTTREVSSQHPYAEHFVGKPYVWTVDASNLTAVRQAIRDIKLTQVKPFTPREFTCAGMLERLQAYITHQDFCTPSSPTWPPEGALRTHLGPLSLSCVSVCRRSGLVCEPALFHHLNNPKTFSRLGLSCSAREQEVNHLFPAYSPWGRRCGLQAEPLLFSCAGSDPQLRRLCPCRTHLPGQVALSPHGL